MRSYQMKTVLNMNEKYLTKLTNYYRQYEVPSTSPHIIHLFQTDYFTISVYKNNKVLFQGKDAVEEYKQWSKVIGVEPNIIEPNHTSDYINQYYEKTVIGSDEVGTGDFFGPVVVTAALVSPKDYAFLQTYQIRDSKTINDRIINEIAPILMKNISHHTLVLDNEKFNQLTKDGYNMNKIKAYLHNHAIKKMMVKKIPYDTIIIDAFCNKKQYFNYLKDQEVIKDIELIEKGESVHLSVAVAAIIARYRFLQEMNKLSHSIDITLPKGASASVDAIAKLILLKYGEDIFNKIAKVNFKNYQKIRQN